MQLISQWEQSDYALLLIKERIPENYDVYMAGWDTSPLAASDVYGIHHPSGDVKKISIYNGKLNPVSWGEVPMQYHWEVPQWSKGTKNFIYKIGVTEPGSSGSPLFSSRGLIIGHLHGGQSSCMFPLGYDMYGALSSDWIAPPEINQKLSTWLNPTKLLISYLPGHSLNYIRKLPQNQSQGNRTWFAKPNPPPGAKIRSGKIREAKARGNQPDYRQTIPIIRNRYPK